MSWASSKFHLQDTTAQKNKNTALQIQMEPEPIDSVACDYAKPYFTNLRPAPKQREVDLSPRILFTANDDNKEEPRDVSGIDTSTVFITIKVHPDGPRILKARPRLVRFVDGFYKIDYDFTLPAQLNYDDTVWVELEANDLSRARNYGNKKYKFFIKKDPFPPQLAVIQPIPFSNEIPPTTSIVFLAKDNKNMLDENSAQLVINNQTITWDKLEFVSAGNGDTIKYQPESRFEYNDRIDVSFQISDVQGNRADTTFWFDTITDTAAPEIIPIRPLANETEVILNTEIVIFCSDNVSGLDTSTIVFKVNNLEISSGDYSIVQGATGDTIKYQPSVFQWNDTVNVYFSIKDFAHNQGEKSYQFFIKQDHVKPVIQVISPLPDEDCVDDSAGMVIYVADEKSGLDKNSANLLINGNIIDNEDVIWIRGVTGDSVKYFPPIPFNSGETIDVSFSISDSAGNTADTRYAFTIETMPEIRVVSPLPGDSLISNITLIELYVPETACGIDTSLVHLVVNQVEITHSELTIQFDGSGFLVIYQPSVPFDYSGIVQVQFSVTDFSGNSADTSYQFKIEPEPFPPEITLIAPQAGMTCVDDSASIVIFVSDSLSGIDISTVDLRINATSVQLNRLEIIPAANGDTVKYTPLQPFMLGASVNVNFSVADSVGNVADTSYTFTIETIPAIQVVRPLPGETNVSANTNIIFYVPETACGIDTSTTFLIVNQDTIGHSALDFFFDGKGDSIKYQPSNPFPYGSQVTVSFKIGDFSANFADTAFAFTIIPDTIPPAITVVNPQPEMSCVDTNAIVVIFVSDSLAGVDVSTISLRINSTLIPVGELKIISEAEGYTIKYTPQQAFELGSNVRVAFSVADLVGNVAETSYAFTIETIPDIQVVRPLPGETGVSTMTDVVLFVPETICKIDTNSYILKVNDTTRTNVNIALNGGGYEFQFVPDTSFVYDDTINVYFSILDSARNFVDTSYYFVIESPIDTIPPVIEIVGPLPDESCVEDSATIVIFVSDSISGIDTSTVALQINSASIPGSELEIIAIGKGDTIKYMPSDPFNLGEVVAIDFSIADFAGNIAEKRYTFAIESVPEIQVDHPQPGETNVEPSTDIVLYVPETSCKIDANSYELTVNGIAQTNVNVIFEDQRYKFQYIPSNSFSLDDTVNVTFGIADFAANWADTSFYFVVRGEIIKPRIAIIRPRPDETNVDDSTDVKFYVYDNESGIDTSSLRLNIDSELIDHSKLDFVPTPAGFFVTHVPDNPFDYDDTVDVIIFVKDNSGNSADTSYSFFTEPPPETIPPKIAVYNPKPGATGVAQMTNIKIYTFDLESGVDTSEVELYVDSLLVPHSDIVFTKTPVGYFVDYQSPVPFPYDSTIYVDFTVKDFARNKADTSFSFTIETSPGIEIELIDPQPGMACVDDSLTILIFASSPSGIDRTTVNLKVKDEQIPDSELEFKENTSIKGDTIKYTAPAPFALGEVVDVYFSVEDSANNFADTSYAFTIEVFPQIQVDHPQPGETGVSQETDIVLYVPETPCKIDTSSFIFFLNDTIRTNVNVTFEDQKYKFQYIPLAKFAFSDTVRVNFSIADFAGNWVDTSYHFVIRPDDIPPKIAVIRPLPNATEVDTLTDIKFYIYDFESGIDTSSLVVKVDSVLIEHSKLNFNKTPSGFFVTYQPTESFPHLWTVAVDIFVKDKADNGADTSYTFVTEPEAPVPDTIPPEIEIISPEPNELCVDTDSEIFLIVSDSSSGVDITTAELKIDGNVIDRDNLIFESSDDSSALSYSVRYSPSQHFAMGASVTIDFKIADRAHNYADTSYYFTCETVPQIEIVSPKPGETDVEPNANIVINVPQTDCKIDTSSFVLKVNDRSQTNVKISFDGQKYEFRYVPDAPFPGGKDVGIYFEISNNKGNRADTSYAFEILWSTDSDTIPPRIEIVGPKENARKVPTTSPIQIVTWDEESGVDESKVQLTVLGKIVDKSRLVTFETKRSGQAEDSHIKYFDADSIHYQPPVPFPQRRKIIVKFRSEDKVGNVAEVTYHFYTEPVKIIVRSNPFTPNDDGINDEVEFNFKKLDVVKPVLKIFDIHNQLQKVIDRESEKGKMRWNGRDDRGKPLLPGVYFYVLLDGNKPKARGIIAIAK